MHRIQLYLNQLMPLKQIHKKHNILIIGSGLMAETLIDHLLLREENNLTIASLQLQEAQQLIAKKQRCQALYLDIVKQTNELTQLVRSADIVVAYVPPQFMVGIARVCLAESRHLVTAQYIKPEIQQMHSEALRKNILFLNEIGLDPGLDHLATYSVQQQVQQDGGKILEYESWCGGLPSPEYTDNPFGYKFSWSPLAAIKNINNDARYIENGVEKYISGDNALYSRQMIKINPAFMLEGFPNRDSVPYKELYGLKDCTKLIRGTLRYPGFSVIMMGLRNLGLISEDPISNKNTNKDTSFYSYINQILKDMSSNPTKVSDQFLNQLSKEAHTNKTHSVHEVRLILGKIFTKILYHEYYNLKSQSEIEQDVRLIFEAMDWLRMFDEKLKIRLDCSHVENLGALMQSRLNFQPGETDLVVMQHIFKIVYPNDSRVHTKKSTLIMTGDKNGQYNIIISDRTAMAKTVSIPTAIAVQLILDGKIIARGVHLPNMKEINEPMIQELKKYGLMCVEEEA